MLCYLYSVAIRKQNNNIIFDKIIVFLFDYFYRVLFSAVPTSLTPLHTSSPPESWNSWQGRSGVPRRFPISFLWLNVRPLLFVAVGEDFRYLSCTQFVVCEFPFFIHYCMFIYFAQLPINFRRWRFFCIQNFY